MTDQLIDTTSITTSAIKTKHRAMWALGDYAAIASEVIPSLGGVVVEALDVQPGERVLDLAAGSGNASIPAALRKAQVVACDLTPELLERGREHADAQGLTVDWQVGDCEALPFPEGSFDVVMSCVGVMFAPFHERSAAELIRVTRSGGRIGLLNWTPEGFIGQMFAAMKPYAAAPPPGAQPPPRWGNEEHVRGLLGSQVSGLTATRAELDVDCFTDAAAFLDFFKTCYGPTIATYKLIEGEPDRVEALDAALIALAERHDLGGGAMKWEYLLVTAQRC